MAMQYLINSIKCLEYLHKLTYMLKFKEKMHYHNEALIS